MTIFQHTWHWMIEQSPNTKAPKTQTRRLVQAGDYTFEQACIEGAPEILEVRDRNWRVKWRVGQTYSIQPGRGKPGIWFKTDPEDAKEKMFYHYQHAQGAPSGDEQDDWHEARYRVVAIRREDVRDISNEDVRAEGYSHARDFLHVWCGMHDKWLERQSWGETMLMARPTKRYDAWALTIETVTWNAQTETFEVVRG